MIRVAFRSPRFFNEPGLFVLVGKRSICLVPLPGRSS